MVVIDLLKLEKIEFRESPESPRQVAQSAVLSHNFMNGWQMRYPYNRLHKFSHA